MNCCIPLSNYLQAKTPAHFSSASVNIPVEWTKSPRKH